MNYIENELARVRELYAELGHGEPPMKDDGTLDLQRIIPGVLWAASFRAVGDILNDMAASKCSCVAPKKKKRNASPK